MRGALAWFARGFVTNRQQREKKRWPNNWNDNMAVLVGNMLVAQAGQGTCATNAGLVGAITQAGRYPELIGEIYGALNSVPGILREQFIDFLEEKQQALKGLRHTPGAALGVGEAVLDRGRDAETAARNLDRLFQVFETHDIRYFFLVGDRAGQRTALAIHQAAAERGYELRVIGIPASVENELARTDHSPGYGSAVKHAAVTVREAGLDAAATGGGHCCVIEVSSREVGWLAAGTVLAKRAEDEAPHFILLPEIPVAEERLLEQTRETALRRGHCVIVTAEGARNEAGNALATDTAGNPVNAGAALTHLIKTRLGLSVCHVALGATQRSAGHFASATDLNEAYDCGRNAVLSAVNGQSGFMIKLVRENQGAYKTTIGLELLENIARETNAVPADWVRSDVFLPHDRLIQHVRPLIEGEVSLPLEQGLPDYVRLARVPVETRPPTS
jgi:6-phosphofructokinase 1